MTIQKALFEGEFDYNAFKALFETYYTQVKNFIYYKTSLINKDTPLMTRIMWSILSASPMVQSAEKGAYPEVMCATEDDLNQQAYYGPTGRMYWVGPVGECKLEPHAQDMAVASKLWTLSEKATAYEWNI